MNRGSSWERLCVVTAGLLSCPFTLFLSSPTPAGRALMWGTWGRQGAGSEEGSGFLDLDSGFLILLFLFFGRVTWPVGFLVP